MFHNNALLGFDYLEKMMEDLSKSSESYPPYNIERIGNMGIRITIAVAGFKENELNVDLDDNKLIVSGTHADSHEVDNKQFIYRGIASRKFKKAFLIDKSMKILEASLENGLLHIDMEKPEVKKEIKSIKIKSQCDKAKQIK